MFIHIIKHDFHGFHDIFRNQFRYWFLMTIGIHIGSILGAFWIPFGAFSYFPRRFVCYEFLDGIFLNFKGRWLQNIVNLSPPYFSAFFDISFLYFGCHLVHFGALLAPCWLLLASFLQILIIFFINILPFGTRSYRAPADNR